MDAVLERLEVPAVAGERRPGIGFRAHESVDVPRLVEWRSPQPDMIRHAPYR